MVDLPAWQILLIVVAVAAGGLVQGSIGFGFALVSAAVINLIEPDAIPGMLLLLAFAVSTFVLWREHEHIDGRGMKQIVGGLLLGTPAGVVVVRSLPQDMLTVAFGAAIVVAVGLSVLHPDFEPTGRIRVAGGALSGLITTVSSTGGPAIALLYQRHEGPVIRSTLAVPFLISACLSVTGLALAGEIGRLHVALALMTAPGLVVGLAASTRVKGILDAGWLRPAVLVFSAGSGVASIIRALV